MANRTITRRALLLPQHKRFPLFLFALRPRELLDIASISRITRDEDGNLIGYQRKEVQEHVKEILDYLNRGEVVFPNAVILAFDEDGLEWTKSRGPSPDDGVASAGKISITVPAEGAKKPAWIIDGQQRALALARTTNGDLAVPVAAIAGATLELQRDQFIKVNNTRPLPRGLITELLPEIDMPCLPKRIAQSKLPSALCEVLNRHPESPFRGLIKRPSSSPDEARVAAVSDTQVVEMIKARIQDPGGCLFPYRNIATGETDTEAIQSLLIGYWRAVRDTFPDAWGLPPTKSRLMHGVGIKAMGNLMDQIVPRVSETSGDRLYRGVRAELARISGNCAWTEGSWAGLQGVAWNELENTTRSVKLLTNALFRDYLAAVRVS